MQNANQVLGDNQFNLSNGVVHPTKTIAVVIQLTIAIFTGSLIWFSFIYYPKAVDRFARIGLPQKSSVSSKAATIGDFPIQTDEFRVVYEKASNTYYAFVEGNNLAQFVDSRNRANLALKTALSLESICSLNVIYSSTKKLEIPQDLKNPASCK